MLKYVASVAFCVFALLFACEPNGSELMEPVVGQEPNRSPGNEQANQQDGTTALDAKAVQALAEVNNWRQKGCTCGDVSMPATTKVTWNSKLYEAALAHAKDMNANNYFSHTSPSGENVYNRLVQSGYIGDIRTILAYGENIAFGNFDLQAAVKKWLDSSSHCANLMRDSYREMAIAHDGNYWVQVFGATRD
ncbi:CAP domain-containing protein [Parapedobacter sp. 10938]|uniref:CAP domain-containing protein n=1 Tax=Parapedobacter flavus TaxID=3110225 RepID=UPI002DBE0CA6|nr:CAP domain-containing protein [Parapedobacter sp. 10938]MEC3880498.1 CAP domain-containing protein [Parapedobacter sp. 10938]